MSLDQDPSWAQLMVLAQKGDQQAYEKLLQGIYPAIRSFVIKRVGPYGFDEDVVQECLMAIHKAKRTYDPDREFKPWMYAITRNKLIDLLRKRQRIGQREVLDNEFVETKAVDSSYIESEDLNELVQSALSELPDEMKRAVEMTKLKGLSTKEAAQQESTTEAAIRTRISRAYKLMRIKLEKEIAW